LPALLEALARAPREAHRVMLVGHNPGLASLLDHLAPTTGLVPGEGDRAMPTASLARLAMPRDWVHLAKGCARLVTLVRASDLPEKFPYPSPHSSELRNRPAYYYTQSSVSPYRLTDDGPQMLVILSAKKRHTIVPKGIKEPGLSAQESAAKEAVEEAGVEGVVEDAPLGSYVYRKWGASCSVQVYALRVTRVLPEDQWPESHRGREWVTPEEASARLAQPALASMVTALAERLRAS
jgi:phosphohistidine phosphatase